MRTHFSLQQLADPNIAEAERNLRACVHCGICTATCPTYVLLGDERDSPRGRIVMMQAMLEEGGPPSLETVRHIDRCLSCLGCSTACPSGVDYARLVDTARAHIQTHYRRPFGDWAMRWLIANVLTRPAPTRFGLGLARLFSPIARLLPGRLGVMARMGAAAEVRPETRTAIVLPSAARRIALMPGCVQAATAPQIDAAVTRVLARRGLAAVPLAGAGCCGALVHHLGQSDAAKAWAKRAIEAFERAGGADAFDAILISATGCTSHLADYAHMFRDEPRWAKRAQVFAAKVKDFSMIVEPRPAKAPEQMRVAYHVACSLRHGLKLSGQGEALLAAAGYEVVPIPEGHLCCGAAGSYSILEPEISAALRKRKLANAKSTRPDVIASGNIGCLMQLSGADAPPAVHLAELIDWAEGGPMAISNHKR
jgi:glycolate oxidase iron-sulfur subunit